ncbi:uncharacterized protein LOC134238504 isoform X2 [Saccostrea cucullata]|uniref:uncharacterized protein LOC134238504 isoform X2 n=1 Tax=Saccostrea cuccullata TaxID=36930 RepID=UPI002ED42B4C
MNIFFHLTTFILIFSNLMTKLIPENYFLSLKNKISKYLVTSLQTVFNMAASMLKRNKKGRFKKSPKTNVLVDHNYVFGHICEGETCETCFPGMKSLVNSKKFSSDGWRNGRRVIEWNTVVDALENCCHCKCGPLYLTKRNIKGEMKLGLGGYLYIQCTFCLKLNRIPYGKTHKDEGQGKGMPSFCINTKVGAAMIDSVGGPQRMNNLLTTLDLPFINNRAVSQKEEDDFKEEFTDLGIAVIPDEFVGDVSRLTESVSNEIDHDTSFDPLDHDHCSGRSKLNANDKKIKPDCNAEDSFPQNEITCASSGTFDHHQGSGMPGITHDGHKTQKIHPAVKKKLSFAPKSRRGMTVCIDHGWQKRGFDSLTGHTFMMSKENKVLKTVIKHRTCGVCKWWRRNRPGLKVREHCVCGITKDLRGLWKVRQA